VIGVENLLKSAVSQL